MSGFAHTSAAPIDWSKLAPKGDASPPDADRQPTAPAPTATPGAGGTSATPSPGRGFDEDMQIDMARDTLARGVLAQSRPGSVRGPTTPEYFVDHQEFETMARILAGIHDGSGQIKLGADRDIANPLTPMETTTESAIENIMQTVIGRQLLMQLDSAKGPDGKPRTTTILDGPGGLAGDGNMSFGFNPAGLDPKTPPDASLFRLLVGALHGVQGTMQPGDAEAQSQVGLGAAAQSPMTENAYRAAQQKLGIRPDLDFSARTKV